LNKALAASYQRLRDSNGSVSCSLFRDVCGNKKTRIEILLEPTDSEAHILVPANQRFRLAAPAQGTTFRARLTFID
jgi:hypothetical protein